MTAAEKTVYAGIDIGGTNIKFGLVDSDGHVVYRRQRPTMAQKGPTPLMHLVTNIAESLLLYAAEEDHHINWLGVGTPGAVDFRTGVVIGPCPNIKGWQGMDIGPRLKERLNMPVYVDNDANLVALAEARLGAAVGAKSVVCVTVGTGIGGGIVLDGALWRGASYSAAELGHISICYDGPQCGCGRQGCIEAYCSSSAILRRARSKLKANPSPTFESILEGNLENMTIKKLFAALKKGDSVAKETLNETAFYLGTGLAGVVNLLNPDTVVIGGGVADGGGGFHEMVGAEIKKRAFDSAVENLKVVKATLGNDAGFIGAGLLGEISK
ncbi:MAG: ROK family protein [candidate division Zixibacteria bacterium]|nr:ROK family protein [candidate division Zixibacteria bacterium]